MTVSVANTEASIDFYIDQLCPLSQKVFQYLSGTLLKNSEALEAMNQVYAHVADNLKEIDQDQDALPHLLKLAWGQAKKRGKQGSPSKKLKAYSYLNNFNLEIRSIVILVDVLGLSLKQVENIMAMSNGSVLKSLIEGRKNLLEVMQ